MPQQARDTDTRRKSSRDNTRFRLLRALDANPGLSQRSLADGVGVSLGALNARLNALIESGLVRVAKSEAAVTRFRYAYALTEKGKAEKARMAGPYLKRRRAEVTALRNEIAALEADFGMGGNDQP